MFSTYNVCCMKCGKPLGFKANDAHGTGPIWCFDCRAAVETEYEETKRWAERYRKSIAPDDNPFPCGGASHQVRDAAKVM